MGYLVFLITALVALSLAQEIRKHGAAKTGDKGRTNAQPDRPTTPRLKQFDAVAQRVGLTLIGADGGRFEYGWAGLSIVAREVRDTLVLQHQHPVQPPLSELIEWSQAKELLAAAGVSVEQKHVLKIFDRSVDVARVSRSTVEAALRTIRLLYPPAKTLLDLIDGTAGDRRLALVSVLCSLPLRDAELFRLLPHLGAETPSPDLDAISVTGLRQVARQAPDSLAVIALSTLLARGEDERTFLLGLLKERPELRPSASQALGGSYPADALNALSGQVAIAESSGGLSEVDEA